MAYLFSRRQIYPVLIAAIFCCAQISPAQDAPADTVSQKDKKDQEGYILNLRDLIKQSKDKIEKVNDKLQEQAILRRNQEREEKAREYYNKAMRLFEDGKFKDAQAYWEKAIKITEHPEMKNYISQSVRKARKQEEAFAKEEDKRLKRLEIERGYSAQEVEAAYQAAVSLYKQKKFLAAKEEFEHVDEMFPDHKATRSYLMIVSQEIQKEQQDLIDKKLKEEAVAKRKEKEEWKKELESKERERQETLQKQAEALYTDALKLYKMKQFPEAKSKFQEIEWVIPDYKLTSKYLSVIDDDIRNYARRQASEAKRLEFQKGEEQQLSQQRRAQLEKERQSMTEKAKISKMKEEADFVYKSGVSLFRSGMYEQARDKFEEVQGLYPDYKSTENYLVKIDRIMGKVNSQREEISKVNQEKLRSSQDSRFSNRPVTTTPSPGNVIKARGTVDVPQNDIVRKASEERKARFKDEADEKYKQAVSYYQKKDFLRAKMRFIEVEAIYSDYQDTLAYLAKIDDEIGRLSPESVSSDRASIKRSSRVSSLKPIAKNIEISKESTPEAEFKAQVLEMYNEAIGYYKDQDYIYAREKFEELERVSPNFKGTPKYLVKIERLLKQQQKEQVLVDKEKDSLSVVPKREQSPDNLKDDEERFEWERRRNERVALLKAKEEHLKKLEGDRYREFRAQLLAEKNELAKTERERKRRERQRREDLKKKLREEELAKKEEQKKQEQAELMKRQEAERQKLEAELAQKKAEKEEEQQRRQQELQEAKQRLQQLKEEKIENAKRAAEIAREMEEKKKLLIRQMEDEQKKVENQIVQNDQELEQQIKTNEQLLQEAALEQKKKEESADGLAGGNVPAEASQDEKILESYELAKLKKEKSNKKAEKERQLTEKRQAELKKLQKKDLRAYRKEIDRKLELKNRSEQDKWQSNVEKIYTEALALYREKDFDAAKAKFSMVEAMSPGYASARSYVAKLQAVKLHEEDVLRAELEKQIRKEKRAKRKEKLEKERQAKIDALREKKEAEEQKIQDEKNALAEKKAEENKKADEANAEAQSQTKEPIKKEIEKTAKAKAKPEKGVTVPAAPAKDSSVETPEQIVSQKKISDAAAERQARIELKQKAADDRKAQLEEKRKARLVEKDKIRLEKEKKKREELRQREELVKLKEDINKVYLEALELYKQRQFELSEEKFRKYEALLANNLVPADYRQKMKERMLKDRQRLQSDVERERIANNTIEQKRQEEAKRQEELKDQQRKLELTKLEQKIKEQEDQLARERADHQKRLESIKRREEQATRSKSLDEQSRQLRKSSDKNASQDTARSSDSETSSAIAAKKKEIIQQSRAMTEDEKRRELERMVKQRQEELRSERERIRREFYENLDHLYTKAVKLFDQGFYDDSKDILSEIDQMRPGYKKTKSYLTKIEEKMTKQREESLKSTASSDISKTPSESRTELITSILDQLDKAHE